MYSTEKEEFHGNQYWHAPEPEYDLDALLLASTNATATAFSDTAHAAIPSPPPPPPTPLSNAIDVLSDDLLCVVFSHVVACDQRTMALVVPFVCKRWLAVCKEGMAPSFDLRLMEAGILWHVCDVDAVPYTVQGLNTSHYLGPVPVGICVHWTYIVAPCGCSVWLQCVVAVCGCSVRVKTVKPHFTIYCRAGPPSAPQAPNTARSKTRSGKCLKMLSSGRS